jgi:hypothetical protein
MACGVNGDELIVRVGPADYEGALGKPHTRPFDMTGRPMKGWVMVAPEGLESDADLEGWVTTGSGFRPVSPGKVGAGPTLAPQRTSRSLFRTLSGVSGLPVDYSVA